MTILVPPVDDFGFVKALLELGPVFISRSEAKRLMHGMEKFEEVVLDFAGVTQIGQGFADEVFRVWANDHPNVRILPRNMVAPVEAMVRRALTTG